MYDSKVNQNVSGKVYEGHAGSTHCAAPWEPSKLHATRLSEESEADLGTLVPRPSCAVPAGLPMVTTGGCPPHTLLGSRLGDPQTLKKGPTQRAKHHAWAFHEGSCLHSGDTLLPTDSFVE